MPGGFVKIADFVKVVGNFFFYIINFIFIILNVGVDMMLFAHLHTEMLYCAFYVEAFQSRDDFIDLGGLDISGVSVAVRNRCRSDD